MFNQIDEWVAQRCGKFTASEIAKLFVSGKGGEYFGDGAKTYIRTKAAELLTLEPINGGRLNISSMEWGNAHEHEAVQRAEKELGLKIEYFGGANPKFYEYTDFSGGSPDGLTMDAVIEVKCPYNSGEHIEHCLLNSGEDLKIYNKQYYWQVMMNMLVTGLEKAYFISYDPRFADDHLQIKILPIESDPADMIELKERIAEAEKQLSLLVQLVRN